jgi:hypothetical protein
MKKFVINLFILLLFSISFLFIYLSIYGHETTKFNNLISTKINKIEKNIVINFEKIKIKIDMKNFNFYLLTRKPKLLYKNNEVPISEIKVYINFIHLLKGNINIENIFLIVDDIEIEEIKKITLSAKPSNLKTIILNNIQKGIFKGIFDIKLKNNSEIEKFKIDGYVKTLNANFLDKFQVKNTNFIFSIQNDSGLIEKIQGEINNIPFRLGEIDFKKNNVLNIKTKFTTPINLKNKKIKKIFENFNYKNNLNLEYLINAEIQHEGQVKLDNTLKILDYEYIAKGDIRNLLLKTIKPLENLIFKKPINKFELKDTKVEFNNKFKKPKILKLEGKYILDESKLKKFKVENSFIENRNNIIANFDFDELISFKIINYEKKKNINANIGIDLIHSNKKFFIKKINYSEGKNKIYIKDIKLNTKNLLKSFEFMKVKTYKNEILNNDFEILFNKKIEVKGNNFDATNLYKVFSGKGRANNFKHLTNEINVNLNNVNTNLSKNLKDFNLIGFINKGELQKLNVKGEFGEDEFLDILLKKDPNSKKKFIEVFSSYPEFILNEYNFFKGLSGGELYFTSNFDKELSNSKLKLKNFKLIEAPSVVKLLSIADLGGMVDQLNGDGLRFDDLEINFSSSKKGVNLKELYAIGPSISVLMEGYTENKSGLISFKGTMIPAKTLNNFLSKIPIVGKILIPKEIGEGLFGLSFKIKGLPGKVKTTVNPVKSLTPRFIQKAIEKKTK